MLRARKRGLECGTSMIEVLVTVVILAVGLLAVAGLQMKMEAAEMDSFQRAQGLLLLSAMTERISANRAQAANYVTAGPVGTGDAQPTDCTGLAPGANRDVCEWSNALKGAAEVKSGSSVGAMVGARGCIAQIQPPDPTLGVCSPGIYQVTVTWQGISPTAPPALACATGLYGQESYRRLITASVSVGTTSCF